FDDGLSIPARRKRELRQPIRRVERQVTEAVTATMQELNDVTCVAFPDRIAVAREPAEISVRASVDVGDDRLPLGRRDREEVDRPGERLRTEEDVPAPLHHLDPAYPLDRGRVVHVRLGVRIDRDWDAVLEHEHAPTPASLQA